MTNRRSFSIKIATTVALATSFYAPFTQAQTVISKPAKIIVGFPPGGAADSVARLLANQLGNAQGAAYAPNVIVDNKPGAGGRIAAQFVKAGEADGSQFLLTPASILTIYPSVYKKLGYDPLADFTPVTSVASVAFAFSVSSAVPASVKTVADYVAWAKANPREANYGSPAAGATPHFVGVMFGRAAGIQLNHVPYKGGAPLVSDLMGGQVQAGVNVLPEVLQHHLAGKLRILAVSGTKRSQFLPNVPTFAESGFKDVAATEAFSVFIPSKTPADVVAKLNAAIRTALKAKQLVEGLEKLSFEIEGASSADYTKTVKSELERWAPIVKASGFSAEE
ncbi:MAG: Bug family tripartite tricarboxylate transporter substrate binding protein [Burkholderiaceae bacterium]|nr:Bug family tripartite tricarboxylate transporter substrate binding protein [Burkholderiaceae bacterium]